MGRFQILYDLSGYVQNGHVTSLLRNRRGIRGKFETKIPDVGIYWVIFHSEGELRDKWGVGHSIAIRSTRRALKSRLMRMEVETF